MKKARTIIMAMTAAMLLTSCQTNTQSKYVAGIKEGEWYYREEQENIQTDNHYIERLKIEDDTMTYQIVYQPRYEESTKVFKFVKDDDNKYVVSYSSYSFKVEKGNIYFQAGYSETKTFILK